MAGDTADGADEVDGRDRPRERRSAGVVAGDRRDPGTDAASAPDGTEAETGVTRSDRESAAQGARDRRDADADAVRARTGSAPAGATGPARDAGAGPESVAAPARHAAEDAQVPHADSAPAPADTEVAPVVAADSARKAVRREMGTALLLVAVGAAVVLSLGGRVWAKGAVVVHGSRFAIEASGSAVGKLPAALALLALAAGVATLATRGRGRVVVGVILAAGGAGIVAAAVSGASDRSALDSRAAAKAAVEGARAIDVGHTVWPWITALGGVLILLGGLTVIVRGRNWPGMGSRYETPSARPRRRVATSADMWNALDRGEDPTR
ncbi:TIGR02234 family membrane protein [Yinghuangia sp. ASG 101]|uniref:TIGR02234 family membrane protein n=1 Tax=Yinghuangia sp. ASG 101 TaxID=2896848 RepID=UPI001E53AFBC|nr:TIGR02234 family membrane protein [Yinghuangia sp. ASG 101]UGQ10098.1 TIGR02234 family membrane protein [Yinghuangia sp. ASG 101]